MSATRIACVDFGATKVLAQVRVLNLKHSTKISFDTTKNPNDPEEDYRRLRDALDELGQYGFDAISVGFAGRLDKGGTVAGAGNLGNWAGRNLGKMLSSDYGVPVVVANDGAMLAAVEIMFGILRDPAYLGKSGLVVAPGTGVAVCLFLYEDGKYRIYPGEGAHTVIDVHAPAAGCGCQQYCVESMASGRALEQEHANPEQLSDAQVSATMASPLGTLVANLAKFLPNHIEIVVVSGGIAHKRRSLVNAVEAEAAKQLSGYVPAPQFVLSTHETGGLLGCLAYWVLSNGGAS